MANCPYSVGVEGHWPCALSKIKSKLHIYFQSKKSNGGDCVVDVDEAMGRVIVHFKSAEIQGRVLEKGDHEITIKNERVKLRVYSVSKEAESDARHSEGERSEASSSYGSTEDGKQSSHSDDKSSERPGETSQISAIVLENVQHSVSKDMLELMVENICNSVEANFYVEMIYEINTAVVGFGNTKDAVQFLSNCKKNSRFVHFGISARALEQTRSVKVENLPLEAMEDLLVLYFEKIGGEVEDVKMIPEEQAAIITFLDPKATETVQRRKHQICKMPVYVYLYYKSIGAALYGKDRPEWKMPDPITETIHPAVWKFLLFKKQISSINDQMKNHFCSVDLERHNVKLIPLPDLVKQKGLMAKHIENWKQNAVDAFQKIVSKYKIAECHVSTTVWKVIEREVYQVVKKDVILVPDLTTGVVVVAGLVKDVDKLKQTVEGIVQRAISQIDRKKNSISEEIHLSPDIFYILKQDGLQQRAATTYPELDFTYKTDVKKLILCGLQNEVLHVKNWFLEKQLKMKERQLDIESNILGFLSVVDNEKLSSELFTSRGICAAFKIEKAAVVLIGISEMALNDAEKQLRDSLTFRTVVLEDQEVLKRPEWQILYKKLKETYSSHRKTTVTMKFTTQHTITVSGFPEPVTNVCTSLSDFFNKYSRVEETLYVRSPATVKFIQENKKQTWKSFASSKDVEVFFEVTRARIQFSGSRFVVEEVKNFFQQIATPLSVDLLKIFKPGAKKFFLEKQEIIFAMILKEINCMVVLQEDALLHEEQVKVEDYGISSYYKVQTTSGVTVTVAKANICQFQADAVVNASNEDLKHIGGLAAALLQAAGPKLQDDCDHYIKKFGRVTTGDAIVTDSGRLPCRYVIHAVGPRFFDTDKRTAVHLLQHVVRQSLKLALEKNCRSVAIPAISSGIFGFPLSLCAETIAETVRKHCGERSLKSNSLTEIHLVNHDDRTVQAMVEAVKKVFADEQLQLMPMQAKSPPSKEWNSGASNEIPTRELYTSSAREADNNRTIDNINTRGGLDIIIRTGSIQNATTSVIVNTISEDLDLNKGGVSNAILEAAGPQLQSAIRDACGKSRAGYGSIVITDGYNLKCEKVFHAVCPFWSEGGRSEEIFIKIIQECLRQAEKQRIKSMSFPAIGTGNLRFPKKLVAKLMLSEFHKFSNMSSSKYLSSIVIFLHPNDSKTIECFREEFRAQRLSYTEHGKLSAGQSEEDWPEHLKSVQTLRHNDQPHQDSSFTGQVSSPALGVHSMRVGHLTVEVSSGDITKQSTDAIVNSSNETFSLRAGVSKAIMDAAGKAVESECLQSSSLPNNGMIVTQSGLLPCKCIIHISGRNDPGKIREAVYSVLLLCEEKRLRSVSFPALGTGAGGASPSSVANAMIGAVVDFEKKKKKKEHFLKCVKILIFQAGMVDEFHKVLKKNEGMEQPEEKSVFSKIKDSVTNYFGSASDSTGMNEDFTILGEEFAPTIFHFCGETSEAVSKTKNWIEDLIVKEQTEKIIRDKWIKYFTQEDRAKLQELQKKLTVHIQLEIHGSDSLIKLEGLTRDVLTTDTAIREMIMQAERVERHKREAALLSNLVEWQYEVGLSFLPVDTLTNLTLEQAFQNHQSRVKITINHLEFDADLVRKAAFGEKKTVHLKRTELKGPADTLPRYWDDMNRTDPLVISLLPSSQEYQNVEMKFRKTGLNQTIVKIERIQNSMLWKSYQIKKNSMQEKNKSINNEKELFHGTCTTTVEHINAHGFNRSYAGKNAAVIGNGSYFAVNPSYSAQNTYSKPDANGQKTMYLARVLVGEYTQGKAGLVVPPEKGTGNAADLYDSVVDNPNNPQVFVIFSDTQAYPEYLITFS